MTHFLRDPLSRVWTICGTLSFAVIVTLSALSAQAGAAGLKAGTPHIEDVAKKSLVQVQTRGDVAAKADGVTVHYLRQNWCSERVEFLVEADSPSFFEGNRLDFQRKVLPGIRLTAEFSCAQMRELSFTGYSGGRLYFVGLADKNNGFALEGLFAR